MNQKKNTPAQAVVIPGLQQCLAQLRAGNVDAFEAAARDLAARYPNASRPLQLVGVAALMRGNLQEAVDKLQAAARLNQNDASIWDNLGVALQRAGHLQAAIECFQGSVRLDPNVAAVWANAAATYGEMGDHVLARNTAARAVKLDPNLVEAHLNLGNALRCMDDYNAAIVALLRAVELDPECVQAHMGLSRALALVGRFELALHHARRAMEIDPSYLGGRFAYHTLCNLTENVVDDLRHLCALNPNDIPLAQGLLWYSLMDDRQSAEEVFAAHVSFGQRFEPIFEMLMKKHENTVDENRQLQVGFLSGDLRRHPVADHLVPLWEGLDRQRVAVHAYYTHRSAHLDDASNELKELADAWVETGEMDDDALARRIRDDRIDILIDLGGHTDHNRVAVLLRKPAPIQMHWVGYPHSTGLRAIDYYIVDSVLVPEAVGDSLFTEKLLRLPTYNNQRGMPGAPAVSPLPALANGYVTYGVTARSNKINSRSIQRWARVLEALPTSRLVIADLDAEEKCESVVEMFRSCGIAPDRLDIRGRLSEAEYMLMHNEIDIILDTFPFNGGTTVTHGLHMGVPTVTLAGVSVPQRMAAARLAAVGLQDWIAESDDAYVALAVSKATDLFVLGELREGLRRRQEEAPVRGREAFARAFEQGLRQAWRLWCGGCAPDSITVAHP